MVAIEYRLLGPVEALADGRQLKLGGPRPRAVLAALLLHAGQIVSRERLIDDVWSENPPDSAANVLQGYVSQLRKELGRDAIATREPGYALRLVHDSLDLHLFERLASEGADLLERGSPEDAAALLNEALALWRGPALADVVKADALRSAAARLDELRLNVLERRLEADLARGRHGELVGELESLTADYPLRERPRALHMLALYRCGRQADALAAYRASRQALVEGLGIEPGPQLQELERAILNQDPALDPDVTRRGHVSEAPRIVVVGALDQASAPALVSVAEPLVQVGERRELVLVTTVTDAGDLGAASARLRELRDGLLQRGVDARSAAFTSLTPGSDLTRLASEQDADLIIVDAPERLLEDSRLLALLDDAHCDVAVLVDGTAEGDTIVVPFAGAEHDWAAVELGAWFSLGTGLPLLLAGAARGTDGSDASRLIASASLAVQRVFRVHADPLLIEPTADSLIAATERAALVVVGLTDRWRRDGVGHARTALAASPHHPTLLVRRGVRPGGLVPRSAQTRFTWTFGAAAG
jgi:DNA-binding SARP family transcriptional activator